MYLFNFHYYGFCLLVTIQFLKMTEKPAVLGKLVNTLQVFWLEWRSMCL